MTKTNFLVGMGMGVAVGSLAGMTISLPAVLIY